MIQAKTSLVTLAATALLGLPGAAQEPAAAPAPATPVVTAATAPAAPTADVPAAMAVLVPDDASVMMLAQPLAQLEEVAGALAAEIDPQMAGMVSVDMLMAMALPPGMDGSAIDRTRPLGVAVGPISMGPEPQVYALIPTSNPEAIKSVLPEGMPYATRISEGYLGVTLGAEYGASTGASALLGKLPVGMLSVAVDVETLMATFRPIIDFSLQMARAQFDTMEEDFATMGIDQDMDLSALMDAYFGVAEGMLDSVVDMRMALDVDETLVDLRMAYGVAPDSPMAAFAGEGGTDIARLLPLIGDEAIAMLMGADFGTMMGDMMPFFESMMGAYPPEMAEGLTGTMEASQELYDLFGDAMAVTGDFTEDGMRMVAYYDGANHDAVQEQYTAMLREPYWEDLGIRYLETRKGRLGDTDLTRYTFELDPAMIADLAGVGEVPAEELAMVEQMMAAIYGERLALTFAQVADLGVMVIGDDDAFVQEALTKARVGTDRRPPADMARLVDLAATSSPFLGYRIDLARLMTSVIPSIEATMGAPSSGLEMFEGTHLPMTFYMAVEPTSWTGGLMLDLVQISDAILMIQTLGDL